MSIKTIRSLIHHLKLQTSRLHVERHHFGPWSDCKSRDCRDAAAVVVEAETPKKKKVIA